MSVPSDESLVAAARAGDEHAYAGLHRRHSSYIASLVHRTLGSDADLDDIVQETFVVAFRQLDGLTAPDRLRSFLVTVAVRRIHARLSLRYRARALFAAILGTSATASDPDVGERVQEVFRALDRVPTRHRLAWILHRVEGFTLPEVAAHTGASLATVKRWIVRVDATLEDDHAP